MNYVDPHGYFYTTCTEEDLPNNKRSDSLERELVRKLLYTILTEKEYEIYFMRYHLGLSRRAIASFFDIKDQSVYRALDRVNAKVDKVIKKLGTMEDKDDELRDKYFYIEEEE